MTIWYTFTPPNLDGGTYWLPERKDDKTTIINLRYQTLLADGIQAPLRRIAAKREESPVA